MSLADALDTLADQRSAEREEVFFRTRCSTAAQRNVPVQIVNISATGFMARTEGDFAIGDIVTVKMPVVSETRATIRWALGGRVGAQFERMIDLTSYLNMLAEMVRGTR